MATLTGELISETYDSLLKVTDNNTITGVKKRITDGFGNEIPLLLSSTDLEIDGKLILSALEDVEIATKFITLRDDNSIAYRSANEVLSDIGGASISSISGTINQIAKFDTTGSITSSIITEVSDKIGIDLSTPNNKLAINVDLPNSGVDLQIGSTTYARFGIISPGIPGEPGVDNDCYIGSTINNDFLVLVNNTEALRVDTLLRLKVANIPNATSDTDKFLVSDSGVIKYRSGLEILSDLGAVPYSGATTDVDLGVHDLTANAITLDPTPSTIPTSQGSMYFDSADQTVAAVLNGTIMKIGEDLFFQIKNQSGSTIPKGTSVRFDGVVGSSGRIKAVPFIANGSVPSIYFLGVTSEDIPDGGDGKAFYFGKIRNLNTNAYPAGTILYASTTVAGGFQTTAPVAPNNIISIAAVTTQGTSNGTILVRPLIGSNINNDEGVKITSPTTGDLLQLQSSGLWENKSGNNAGLVTLATTQTITGEKTFTASRTNINGVLLVKSGSANGVTISSSTFNRLELGITNGLNTYAQDLIFPSSSAHNYTFPSSSGTIALTSNINSAISGTTNYVPKFTAANTIGNSQIQDNGYSVAIGYTTNPNWFNLDVLGNFRVNAESGQDAVLDINRGTTTQSANIYFETNSGLNGWVMGLPNNSNDFLISNSTLANTGLKIASSNNDVSLFGNTSIGYTTNPSLYKLDVNGSGRFAGITTFSSSVAIGIATPTDFGASYKVLDVYGTNAMSITRSSGGVFGQVNAAGTDALYIGTRSNHNVYLTANNSNIVTLNASTGAATFSSTLRVEGAFAQIVNASNPSLYINNTAVQWQNYVKSNNNIAFSDAVRDVLTLGYNGSPSFFQGGNVGIGTTTPIDFGSTFKILNTSGSTGSFVLTSNSTNTIIGQVGVDDTLVYYGSRTNHPVTFSTNTIERMRITSSGRVLIGTPPPTESTYQLDVNGSGRFAGAVQINSNTTGLILNRSAVTNFNGIGYRTNNLGKWFVGLRENLSSDNYIIYNEITGIDTFMLSSSTGAATFSSSVSATKGDFGTAFTTSNVLQAFSSSATDADMFQVGMVGVSNGFTLKRVSSSFYLSWDGIATIGSLGTGTVYSNGGTLTNTNPSDANLKTEITDLSYGLNEIMQLRPVSYLWKNDKINQGKQFGFIAQEVQEVMPDLVKEGYYLGLDKEAIFVTLVNAIKELTNRIIELENK